MRRMWDEAGHYKQESLDLAGAVVCEELRRLYKCLVENHDFHPRDASHFMQEEIHVNEVKYAIGMKYNLNSK